MSPVGGSRVAVRAGVPGSVSALSSIAARAGSKIFGRGGDGRGDGGGGGGRRLRARYGKTCQPGLLTSDFWCSPSDHHEHENTARQAGWRRYHKHGSKCSSAVDA